MLKLEKNHDPRENPDILSALTGSARNRQNLISECYRLYEEWDLAKPPASSRPLIPVLSGLFRKVLSKSAFTPLTKVKADIDRNGNTIPDWKPVLDEQYDKLKARISRTVNVKDFGAAGDGITDDTEAFRKAIGQGGVRIFIPEGIYVTKEIRLPSWTMLSGSGKGVTILRLHDQSPKGSRLVTNRHHWKGDRNILVEDLTLDWNSERLGAEEKTSTWGNHSSCLLYANVLFGWVWNVEAKNAGLHGFDVSSTLYNYFGDGFRAKGGSRYIWLDGLNGYGFGDDGVTVHHSDFISISKCHMCEPSGRAHKRGFSNSNGIEVDDGSRNVFLADNSSAGCFGGIEVKAHYNSSAAHSVQIFGHISLNDNRSFNFRHIGHHKAEDPASKTAFNILAADLLAAEPVWTGLYKGSQPRAMVISAYQNVLVNRFTAIGRPEHAYSGGPVVAVKYRASHVSLKDPSITGFSGASRGVTVFGGKNRADHVRVNGIQTKGLSGNPVEAGDESQTVLVKDEKTLI